ncbi:MAG: HAD-IA family hydrolase [Clostridia bacterium]|nr:HAD-IA family hydrolase [Clostridia bacterium]
MIRGVVFDLDHTLYDRDASDRAAMGRFCDAFPEYICPGVSRQRAQDMIVEAAHKHVYGGWSAIAAYLRQQNILQGGFTDFEIMDFFQRQFFEHIVPFPFVPDMFARLRRMGMKLGLITNGRRFYQENKIAALNMAPAFDHILIGFDPATAKPHPDLFLEMARLLACRPDELVYAGDNPVNDVDASRRAGYVPVWVRTITPWLFPDIPQCPHQVDTVAEIPALVERLNGSPS